MSIPNVIHGSEKSAYDVRTSAQGQSGTPIGTQMVVEDGRVFRYAKSGVGPTVVGALQQGEVWVVGEFGDQAVDTLAAGVFVFTGVGSTTTSLAVDELKDGFVWIDSAANLNPGWRVVSNTAIAAAATTGTITIATKTVDAVAAAEHISFNKSIWRDIIVCPSPLSAAPAGVAVSVIADEGFGYVQTHGMCRVLVIGTIVEGDMVVPAGTTAGGVMPSTNAYETVGPQVGYTVGDLATTEYGSIFLVID